MRKVIVLACILSLLVPVVVLAGCGGGSTSQTPEQVAKAFFAAYAKKDATTSWNLLSANSLKQGKSKADWEKFLKDTTIPENITVDKVTVNGDKATAKVTGTFSGKASTVTVPLVKENGVWKVDMAGMTE